MTPNRPFSRSLQPLSPGFIKGSVSKICWLPASTENPVHVKAILRAKSVMNVSFHSYWIRTHYYNNKNLARRILLKESLMGTRKWSIEKALCYQPCRFSWCSLSSYPRYSVFWLCHQLVNNEMMNWMPHRYSLPAIWRGFHCQQHQHKIVTFSILTTFAVVLCYLSRSERKCLRNFFATAQVFIYLFIYLFIDSYNVQGREQ